MTEEQAISKWERNQSLPDITIFSNLCQILQVSADTLLDNNLSKQTDSDNISDTNILRSLRNSLPPLELIFGKDLVPAFLESFRPELVTKQRQLLAEDGILLPVIRVRDELRLEPNEFMIVAYHKILHKEYIEHIEKDTCHYIVKQLGNVAKQKYADILNSDIIKQLTDNLKTSSPALIEGIVPEKISYSLLLDVLKGFLAYENMPCYLPKIIEIMDSNLREQPDLTAQKIIEIVLKQLDNKDDLNTYLNELHA